MSGEAKSVTERLHEALAARRLEFDPAQERIAARLDALAEELRSSSHCPWWRGLVDSLRLSAQPTDAPRGLYLWGAVGRGRPC